MSEARKVQGKIKAIMDAQTFGSGFTKREFVVTEDSNGKYPQHIVLEFVQDKVSKLDDVNIGDDVSVSFDIRGREYNGRYFNTLQAWNIRVESQGESPAPNDADEDDVPF